MAKDFRIKLKGDRELVKMLDELPDKLRRKYLRQAVVAAYKPVLAEARDNVPVRYGHLRDALDARVRVYRRSGAITAVVGARADVTATVQDEFGREKRIRPHKYLHLVEYGTRAHEVPYGPKRLLRDRKKAQHPGARPAAFMRRAWFRQSPGALRTMENKLRAGLMKLASKGARK